jgi:DNA polymerase-1
VNELTFDLETKPIDRALQAPPPVCGVWMGPADPAPTMAVVDDAFYERVMGWYRAKTRLYGINVAYDAGVLCQWGPEELAVATFEHYAAGLFSDLAIDQKIIDYAKIGAQAKDRLGMEGLARYYRVPAPHKDSSWRMRFWDLRKRPLTSYPQGAIDYVLGDASVPVAIRARQAAQEAPWRAGHAGLPLYQHLSGEEAYKAFALHLISCWGVKTDRKRAEAFLTAIKVRLDVNREVLLEAGLIDRKGKKETKAAKARMETLCLSKGLNVPKTDTGETSLDKEACSRLGDELLLMYSDYSQAGTLVARAEDLCKGVDLPLQTRFDSLLETSRTSTSKPKLPMIGVQAQNFPRAVHKAGCRNKKCPGCAPGAREAMTPREGRLFFAADLPTAELRSLAQVNLDLFQFSRMAEQINAGRDLHLWFGAQVLGITYEQAQAMLKTHNHVKEARQDAKPCNFGFPGGMGIDNFIAYAWREYRVVLSVERATELKNLWLAAFPEMAQYFKLWKQQHNRGRSLKSEDGSYEYSAILVRHMRTGRWRANVPYCATCNTNFQELTATAAARGLMEVQRRAYTVKSSALYGSRVVMYTHDECVAEGMADRSHEAAHEMAEVMAERFSDLHPNVPVSVSDIKPVVMGIYSKGAEQRKDSTGRLVAWYPEELAA